MEAGAGFQGQSLAWGCVELKNNSGSNINQVQAEKADSVWGRGGCWELWR